MMEDFDCVVIDNGSSTIKAGFAGDDAPRCVIPNVVGLSKNRLEMEGMGQADLYAADEALAKRGVLDIKNPIIRGIVAS